MKKLIKNKKGFTLIELIVVMAIMGILVLLAAPRFLGYTKDANHAATLADMKVLENAALVYNVEKEKWPSTGDAIVVSEDTPAIAFIQSKDALAVVKALDEAAISSSIKSLKNKYADYGIVVSGALEGTVVHLKGVQDKDGKFNQYSISLKDAVTP